MRLVWVRGTSLGNRLLTSQHSDEGAGCCSSSTKAYHSCNCRGASGPVDDDKGFITACSFAYGCRVFILKFLVERKRRGTDESDAEHGCQSTYWRVHQSIFSEAWGAGKPYPSRIPSLPLFCRCGSRSLRHAYTDSCHGSVRY